MMTDAEILGHEPPGNAVIYRDGDAVGMLLPITPSVWEVHCGAAPTMRGKSSLAAFRRLLAEFWSDHPEVQELIGVMKSEHLCARYNAARLGFNRVNTSPLTWPDGTVRNTADYRMKRP
ncbi:hypothetical protein [Gluconobacter cerinus]|uniref:hypothetical protein n=1 Tax=Gluconobacter cerinus TaxID=38307 RepID=UPI001B8DA169|nr:hypothetical protein [Gluconobacter cerinus]MBS1026130.1 hypothetical protein [Gluconobacter cerinus]MBS1044561.1 hypothetical protein [Gluconobacter cerinus]